MHGVSGMSTAQVCKERGAYAPHSIKESKQYYNLILNINLKNQNYGKCRN